MPEADFGGHRSRSQVCANKLESTVPLLLLIFQDHITLLATVALAATSLVSCQGLFSIEHRFPAPRYLNQLLPYPV